MPRPSPQMIQPKRPIQRERSSIYTYKRPNSARRRSLQKAVPSRPQRQQVRPPIPHRTAPQRPRRPPPCPACPSVHRRRSYIEFMDEECDGAAPEVEVGGPGAVDPGVVGAAGVSSSECWSATGVSHSLGRQRSRNGTIELTEARRFTQEGISRPVSSWGRANNVSRRLYTY